MPFDASPITSRSIEMLEKVHDLLKTVGWCQNKPYEYDENNNKVAYCLFGAYGAINPDTWEEHTFVTSLGFDNDLQVLNWNDEVGRTKRGVLQKLNKRIRKLKDELLEKSLTHEQIEG